MSLRLETLLERGYFPQELPPPFNTKSLAKFIGGFARTPLPFNTKSNRTSKPEIYNLARTGTLRRELSILNPIHFSLLAACVIKNWKQLEKSSTESKISLTRPSLTDPFRAIGRQHSLDLIPAKRAEVRSSGRFLLKADIIRFYPSVYTHSIPWALHGKMVAKANHGRSLFGNEIDELVRSCQDGQTNGIPVGPDTSLLIAEIILSKIDLKLSGLRLKGLRYIDDYEIVFDSEPDALKALSRLEEALLEFELHLNPAKTKIFALPQRLEDSWVAELKTMDLHPHSARFKSQLIRFFDRAFELARAYPSENVLKYAAGRMSRMRIWRYHHKMAEDLLIQCARAEAGALPAVLASILRNPNRASRRTRLLKEMFHNVIIEHAPQRHSSEVAWSIWACVALKLQLPRRVVRSVLRMEDSVCALLLLHARSLGLLHKTKDLDELQAVLTTQDLYENRWLLSYEASIKQWLPPGPSGDHVGGEPNFGPLKRANVSFYDVSQTVLPSLDDDAEEGDDSYLDRLVTDYYSDFEDNKMDFSKNDDEDEDF